MTLAALLREEEHGANQGEWDACKADIAHFVRNYVKIYDAQDKEQWLPFELWAAQESVLEDLTHNALLIVLKARQLGLSWLTLAYALWLMLFHPAATVLLFSRRDDEAVELLQYRLCGIYDRLPEWMWPGTRNRNDHEFFLRNGSRALAFPTTGGRSYTATLAIIDEAEKIDDLNTLLSDVKPTIDAGGQLVLIATVEKSKPGSAFKRIYEAARRGENDYKDIFLPWNCRPDRTSAWYEAQKRDILARTGAMDELYQEYPATPEEALAAKTLDKRIPPGWLLECYQMQQPLVQVGVRDERSGELPGLPSLPGLRVFQGPQRGHRYAIGADPAEGNPNSDNSALEVIDVVSNEQVASLAEHLEPAQFGAAIEKVALWYNKAQVLVERNNHGHAVLLWLRDNTRITPAAGTDGHPGWLTTSKAKTICYDKCADTFKERAVLLHDPLTYDELSSIDGSKLAAPEGQHDDRAMAFTLALMAANKNGMSMADALAAIYGDNNASDEASSDPELG